MNNDQNQSIVVSEPKEWANPTPAGLVALAVACICFFAMLTGQVGKDALPLIACWLAGGFVVQLIVALLDLKERNHAGGNTFLFFCAFFMLTGAFEMILKYQGLMAGTPLDGRIDGFAWAILAIVLILWTPAFFRKFTLLSVIIVFVDVALPFIALLDLGLISSSLSFIPAYCLLIAAVFAVYMCSAQVVNTAFGRTIYPMPGAPKNTPQDK